MRQIDSDMSRGIVSLCGRLGGRERVCGTLLTEAGPGRRRVVFAARGLVSRLCTLLWSEWVLFRVVPAGTY